MPRKIVSVLLFSFLLASLGCAANPTTRNTQRILTDDQTKLDFDYYPASGQDSPAVILLPDTRCDRKKSFGSFPQILNQAGFAVLAMDFRYKDLIARAGRKLQQIQTIQRQNLEVLVDQDVKSALDFLSRQHDVDPKRICLIGVSLGSRVALKAGVKYRPEALVLVSLSGDEVFMPGSGSIQQLLDEYGDRPILFMTSEKDWGNNYKAAEDNMRYITWVKGKGELKIWPGSGHGPDILQRSDASQFLLSWLKENI